MKAKPFKRTPPPVITKSSPNTQLTRAQLVALIAARIPRQRGDDEGTVRNRVSSRLSAAVKRGTLEPMCNGKFKLNEVGRWARDTWPEKFGDLPVPRGSLLERGRGRGTVRSVVADVVLPGTLDRCHDYIRMLEIENRRLREKLSHAEAQLAEEKRVADIHRQGISKSRRRSKSVDT